MYHMKHTCVNSMLYTDIKNYKGIIWLSKKKCPQDGCPQDDKKSQQNNSCMEMLNTS